MSIELNVGNISRAGDLPSSTPTITPNEFGVHSGFEKGVGSGVTFSEILGKSVEKVNELQNQADTSIKELVAGRSKNIHETLLAIERADSSLKLAMQVRNKILDAYREIMRMQV